MNLLVKLFNPALHMRRKVARVVAEKPGIEYAAVKTLLRNISNTASLTGMSPGSAGDRLKLESIIHASQTGKTVRYEGEALPNMVRNIRHAADQQLNQLLANSAGMQPGSALDKQIKAMSAFIESTDGFYTQILQARLNAVK